MNISPFISGSDQTIEVLMRISMVSALHQAVAAVWKDKLGTGKTNLFVSFSLNIRTFSPQVSSAVFLLFENLSYIQISR